SMTLFIVAIALLVIVERDQRNAVRALELAATTPGAERTPVRAAEQTTKETAEGTADDKAEKGEEGGKKAGPAEKPAAEVERGRVAAFSGVVALLWLVILFLMVWYGG